MTTEDLSLIDSLSHTHPELPRLLTKHREYEQELDGYKRRRWLSVAEEGRRRRLKQLKLAGRDRMEALLAPHRGPSARP